MWTKKGLHARNLASLLTFSFSEFGTKILCYLLWDYRACTLDIFAIFQHCLPVTTDSLAV